LWYQKGYYATKKCLLVKKISRKYNDFSRVVTIITLFISSAGGNIVEFKIRFMPDDKEVTVIQGTNLKDAANLAGIQLKSSCGGAGTCGKCKVELAGKSVLACKTAVNQDMEITIPLDSRLSEHKVLVDNQSDVKDVLAGYQFNPIVRKLNLTLTEPTLEDNTSDLSRLLTQLRKEFNVDNAKINLANFVNIGPILREKNYQVTVTLVHLGDFSEIVDIEAGHSEKPPYGIALDIGTTTIAVNLIDLNNGNILDRLGTYNTQAQYGDDVISRIIYADESADNLKKLQELVINTTNKLIREMLKKHSLISKDISVMIAAGNTTMTHLFLGVSPKYLRLEPYIPAVTTLPPVKAKDLKIAMNSEGYIIMYPSVASYVGGDIVSGALVTGIDRQENITLFIDIGTNGEMVLGNQDWLVTCACSAGPSFEGRGISNGMRAMSGAIEKVEINPENLDIKLSVVGNVPPIGICGSGLIDVLAKMNKAGIINRTGKFNDLQNKRIRVVEGEPQYILAFKEESGNGKDIVVSESDVKNLIRSKGAVYAGIRSMLDMVQLSEEDIETVIIAGGFGNYLHINDAIEIGLLPDIPREKYKFVGNSSLKGAHLALISQEAFAQATPLAEKMTYLELSVGNSFFDQYVSALFLPHTDLSLFPTVA
jgi:uncharacterized 2Fe-2S/4Fe-4S cluster protein (DUF4445 family)